MRVCARTRLREGEVNALHQMDLGVHEYDVYYQWSPM